MADGDGEDCYCCCCCCSLRGDSGGAGAAGCAAGSVIDCCCRKRLQSGGTRSPRRWPAPAADPRTEEADADADGHFVVAAVVAVAAGDTPTLTLYPSTEFLATLFLETNSGEVKGWGF